MRIAYIAAGAGGMYCGSCIHDNTLAAALISVGHEVALVPTYTPIRTDEEQVAIDRVFYGAVNVFLQQSVGAFRRTPRFVDWLLDRPGFINWVARFGASTDATQLGALTLSVLRGEHGHQHKELEKLVEWLEEYRPDIVQITNSMLLGLVSRIQEKLGVPVLCNLSGEELFIDRLQPPFRHQVRAELRLRARDADGFVATTRWYAEFMSDYLGVAAKQMHVVPLGIRIDETRPPRERHADPERPLVIGYLARISEEKGLHHLLEAFHILHQRVGSEAVRLHAAGWTGKQQEKYVAEIRSRVADWGLTDCVRIDGELNRDEKLALLLELDILSVPTVYQEPKGLYVLEALAHGVPVVQPNHGSFPEMIEATGGGLLVEPRSPEELAAALERLVRNPELRLELGRRGRAAVESRFNDRAMAQSMLAVYDTVLATR